MFGGIVRGSPWCEVLYATYRWRRLRWLDAALRCCGPRRSVERGGAHKCSSVCSWAFWVLPLRGPCWTSNVQERKVSGVRGAQGCGVLTWECAGSLAGGNIFSFCPPGWDRATFFCACVCRGSRWPGRECGGIL